MTPELTILALAGLLQAIQFCLMAIPANIELGMGKTTSSRDPDRLGGASLESLVSTKTSRLIRALNNHFEGLILFTIAVLVTELSGQNTKFTAACAIAYLVARIVYIPAYYFGWAPWRSYIWFIGFGATISMIIAALL